MKKSLLFLSAVAVSFSSVMALQPLSADMALKSYETVRVPVKQAEENGKLEFRYYVDGSVSGLTFGTSTTTGVVAQAVAMPRDVATSFAGSKITGLDITTGMNMNTMSSQNNVLDVTLFLSYDVTGAPFYTQQATLPSTCGTKAHFDLDTPYEIEAGKTVYFGYQFTLTRKIAQSMYYLAIDDVPTTTEEGTYIGLGNQWMGSGEYGSLLIGATVEGDNTAWPKNQCETLGLNMPYVAYLGEDFEVGVNVCNRATNNIESVEVEYSVNGGAKQSQVLTLSEPMPFNKRATLPVKITCPSVGDVAVELALTKVNGEANGWRFSSFNGNVLAYNPGGGFKHNILLEEGTGNWCPNCPTGIMTLEYAKEKYNDGSMVLVAYHSGNGDPMEASTCGTFVSWAYTGFPSMQVNRESLTYFYGSMEYNEAMIDDYYERMCKVPTYCKVDLNLEWADDSKTKVKATTTSRFAFDRSESYKICFILVEDGVGPYRQANNMTGRSGFGPFSTGGSYVSWTFNDVARGMYGTFGLDQSLISSPSADKDYTFEYQLPVASIQNQDNGRVVAALVNASSKAVVNVVEVPLSALTSVGDVLGNSDNVSIRVDLGAVVVNGASVTEVYTVDGRRVATAYGEATIGLAPGLYIVKADNLVKKVSVK